MGFKECGSGNEGKAEGERVRGSGKAEVGMWKSEMGGKREVEGWEGQGMRKVECGSRKFLKTEKWESTK
jgi:hypothetical protein